MDIEYIDANTGKALKRRINDPSRDFFDFLASFDSTEAQIKNKIDSLNISADAKALLFNLSKFVFTAGKFVLKIGKKIIDIILSLLKNFPYLSFGVIFGLVLGAAVAAIPLIGAALGSLATTIALALGVTLGGLKEFESEDLKSRIDGFIKELAPLRD